MVKQSNNDRCTTQQHFIELLGRLRNGNNTEFDWQFIMTSKTNKERLIEFENAIRLFTDNNSVNSYNLEKLIKLKKPS